MSNKKGVSASLKDSKGRKRECPFAKEKPGDHNYGIHPDEPRSFKKLRSGLLNTRERDAPPAQKDIMHRNATASPLLSLPPEIRNRIFNLVLGCQRLWISYKPHEHFTRTIKGQRHHVHVPGGLYHQTGARFDKKLHLGLLRVCRQTYGEVALLPYALNTFFFKDVWVRRKFMKERRPVQQRAIGNYKYMSYDKMKEVRLSHGGPKLVGNASNRHRISTNPFFGPSTYQLTGSDKWRRAPLASSIPCEGGSSGAHNLPRPPNYMEQVKEHPSSNRTAPCETAKKPTYKEWAKGYRSSIRITPCETAKKPTYKEWAKGYRSSIRIAPCETPRKPTYKEWVRDQVVTTRAVNE